MQDFGRFHTETYTTEGLKLSAFPKKNNSPVEIEFTGKYFKNPDAMEQIEFIIGSNKFRPYRIDTAIDEITVFNDFEPNNMPISLRKNFHHKTICNHLDEIETWFIGKSDFRLRYYNKLEENPDYSDDYGLEHLHILECWRFEVQLRGKTLRNLLVKTMGYTLDDLIQIPLRYASRNIYHRHLNDMACPSAYIKKSKILENQREYWRIKYLKDKERYDRLSEYQEYLDFNDALNQKKAVKK